ncbi:MAG TPA: NADH-quinone oxidoreductase subunit NuoK [Candidatus Hypogeohydataceae bacterium YC38]|jgi:NADH-quinone oxidoreductase subunit K|nr:NADH-quinone oxidoreductase subunit NuoK [Candidatus Brocadiales bacterium]
MVTTSHYLILGSALFGIGVLGFLMKRNVIVLLMCVELMINGAGVSFVALCRQTGSLEGQVFVLFAMVIAAVEIAVGLSLILLIFRNRATLDVDKLEVLKW